MKTRIRELRLLHELKQSDLAARLGVTQSSLSHWETGAYDIDPSALTKLAQIFDCSVDYLLYHDSVKKRKDVTGFGNVLPISTKKVPLLGTIACGKPIYTNEEFGEYADVWADLRCDFCLRCKGDSMTGARINDGDLVFCRATDMVDNGRIAAVVIGEEETEATLKRWYYYPEVSRIVLSAENPAYAPIIFDGEQISKVRVLGEAVAFQSVVK
jgi:repressor LexA